MIPIKAVAIDNDQNELNLAIRGLVNANISCIPVLYESISGIAGTIREPLKGIRLVFMDINLIGSGDPKPQELVDPIANVIRELIAANEGPYALIFWSKIDSKVDELKELLSERHSNIPPPSVIGLIDKKIVLSNSDNEIDAFMHELNLQLDNNPIITALVKWESQCTHAATETINNLLDVAGTTVNWGDIEDNAISVSKLLRKIAEETVGKDNLSGNEITALIEGLAPIHLDSLVRLIDKKRLFHIKDAIYKGDSSDDFKVDLASLNSFYHIDTENCDNTERGAFIEIDFKRHLEGLLENKKIAVFREYIVAKGNNEETKKKDIQACLKTSKFGLIEISPACDYAQNNARSHRYVLSVLIKSKYIDDRKITNKGKHNAIEVIPNLKIFNEEYSLRINYRYVFGLDPAKQGLDQPIFRLREQILNDIVFKYGKYASRPGIISFR
jgi:hypothetical protein